MKLLFDQESVAKTRGPIGRQQYETVSQARRQGTYC